MHYLTKPNRKDGSTYTFGNHLHVIVRTQLTSKRIIELQHVQFAAPSKQRFLFQPQAVAMRILEEKLIPGVGQTIITVLTYRGNIIHQANFISVVSHSVIHYCFCHKYFILKGRKRVLPKKGCIKNTVSFTVSGKILSLGYIIQLKHGDISELFH